MRDLRRNTLLAALLTLLAIPAQAAFQETLTASERWKDVKPTVDRLQIVAADCHDVMDCTNFEQRIHERIAEDGPRIELVAEKDWREFLFGLGKTSYSPELREAAVEHFGLKAVAEVKIVDARRSEGFGSSTRSVVNLELTIYAVDGGVLVHASGTGKPKNVVSGPEKVGARIVGRILEKAFGR